MTDPFAAVPGAVVDDVGLQHVGSPLVEQRRLAAGAALAPRRRPRGHRGAGRGPPDLAGLALVAGARAPRARREHRAAHPRPAGTRRARGIRRRRRRDHVAHRRSRRRRRPLRLAAQDALPAARRPPRSPTTSTPSSAARPPRSSRISPAAPSGVPARVARPVARASRPAVTPTLPVDPHPGADRDWAEAIVTREEEQRIADAATRGELELAGHRGGRGAARRRLAPALEHRRRRAGAAARARLAAHRRAPRARAATAARRRSRRCTTSATRRGASWRSSSTAQAACCPSTARPCASATPRSGIVTSAALHYEEGPIALAVVRRTTPVDAPLTVDTADGPVAAAQEMVVPPDAGATANVPRITRLSRRAAAQ